MSKLHPDEVLSALLLKTKSPKRIDSLRKLHALCQAQATSGKDFSRKTMSNFCDKSGILAGRMLYNRASLPLVELLDAWQNYVGASSAPNSAQKVGATENILKAISDPALRALVQSKFVELEKVKAEIRMIKAITTVQLDQRKQVTTQVVIGKDEFEQLNLSNSEKEAIIFASSIALMHNEHWKEGASGQVLNAHGRTVYPPGYLRALRKISAMFDISKS